MTDPLAIFYRIPITVERLVGTGPHGSVYADPDGPLLCRLRNERRLVRAADGREVVSEAGASLPIATPTIPVGSKVTLPDGRTSLVLAEARHETGIEFMPHYYSIDLA